MAMTFEGRVIGYSPAAVRFEGVYWDDALWFPLSQVEIIDDNEDTGSVVLKLADWLAKKTGIYEFTNYTVPEIEAMGQRA